MNHEAYMDFRLRPGEKPLDRIVNDGGLTAIFRTIVCIGDSLASGEFESPTREGTNGYYDMFEYSWGQFIGRATGSKVYNFSQGGMTASAYNEEFADDKGLWGDDKLGQAYIIALGVNDIINDRQPLGTIDDIDLNDYRNNAKTFAGNYAKIIQRLQTKRPDAKYFLVSMPSGQRLDLDRKGHRDLLEQMTHIFPNCYLIDLYEYFDLCNDPTFMEEFWLRGHLSPAGYLVMGRVISSYIDYIIRANPKDFKYVGFVGTPFYYEREE